MSNHNPSSKNSIADSDISAGRDAHIGDVIYNNFGAQGQTVTVPKHLTNYIPTNDAHILGRTAEMTEIAEHLAQKRPTVLVNGIGGIGKTTVATKYMVQQRAQYAHFAWLTVSGSIEAAFVNNAELKEALHVTQEVNDRVNAKDLTGAFLFLFKIQSVTLISVV